MASIWAVGLGAFVAGAVAASGVWSVLPSHPPPKTPDAPKAEPKSDGALEKANANLTDSLAECDRKLADLRAQGVATAAPEPSAQQGRDRDGGRNRRAYTEPTKEDWERMAQLGTVRVRVPCLRDKPWEPNQRATDRLGLAPSDVEALKEAYALSNQRMTAEIRPLCAKLLGSDAAADKVGANACVDAIAADARKTNPDATKQSLKNVAEVQADKRAAPKSGDAVPAIEQLALSMANESKRFEADLAKKLGPDEAKRLASAPELCTDRRTFRGADDREGRE